MMKSLNILITGAASGIGRACAEHFLKNGHKVIGIDRHPEACEGEFECHRADITDGESLSGVRDELSRCDITLDVILCVAGMHDMVSLVESDFSRMKRLIDVNLLGTMQTNKVFYPLLAPKGRIVIVTSEVATYAPMPFNGLYSISKTALDCYADALRQELNLLGQKVVVVRPGAVETPLARGSADSTVQLAEATKLYRTQAGKFSSLVKSFTGTPMKPEALAKVIYKASTVKHPRLAYAVHRNIGLVLLSILPKGLQLFIIKLLLK